jgi:hypothetical protein
MRHPAKAGPVVLCIGNSFRKRRYRESDVLVSDIAATTATQTGQYNED